MSNVDYCYFLNKKIVGRANALAGGWGNAGAGVVLFYNASFS